MPEGPDILLCATFFKKYLNLSIISNIISHTTHKITLPNDYVGNVIDVDYKGKQMWFLVSSKDKNKNYYIHIHYGLKGWIKSENNDNNINNYGGENNTINQHNVKYKFIINNKDTLYLEDSINSSKVHILTHEQHTKIIDELGIDVFSPEFTLDTFKTEIKKKKCLLASFILNQKIFSGMGNYVKSEIMYLSHLNIKIKTNELEDNSINKLYKNILYIIYSKFMTMIKKAKLHKSDINKHKLKNIPKKIDSKYLYRIYNRDVTDEGQKVIKTMVSGRKSYSIAELS